MRDYAPWHSEHASEVIAEHRHRDGAMLPILHALQEVFGYVPDAAVPMVAAALNLSRAEVHGASPSITTSGASRPAGTC